MVLVLCRSQRGVGVAERLELRKSPLFSPAPRAEVGGKPVSREDRSLTVVNMVALRPRLGPVRDDWNDNVVVSGTDGKELMKDSSNRGD